MRIAVMGNGRAIAWAGTGNIEITPRRAKIITPLRNKSGPG
jgi:hypothetical protein